MGQLLYRSLLKGVASLTVIEGIVSVLVFTGVFFSVLGSIGLMRFPDVYMRIHAATKSATLGVVAIMLATFIFLWVTEEIFVMKMLLAIIFVFLTAPVAALMVSRAAHRVGVPLWKGSTQDDLAKSYQDNRKSR